MSGRTTWLAIFAMAVACGGSTESSQPGGSGGTAGTGGSAGATGGQSGTGGTGGTTEQDAAPDAPNDAETDTSPWGACFDDDGRVDTNLKLCNGGTDACVVRAHLVDCCGTIKYVGVSASQAGAFDVCEPPWNDHFPECGCASSQSTVEQPSDHVVTDISEVEAICTNCTMESCICMTVPK